MDLFGVGGPELLILLFLAGVVLGPQRLARLGREIGKLVHQVRAIATDLNKQLSREIDLLDDSGRKSPSLASQAGGDGSELPEAYRRFRQDFPTEGDLNDSPNGATPEDGRPGQESRELSMRRAAPAGEVQPGSAGPGEPTAPDAPM